MNLIVEINATEDVTNKVKAIKAIKAHFRCGLSSAKQAAEAWEEKSWMHDYKYAEPFEMTISEKHAAALLISMYDDTEPMLIIEDVRSVYIPHKLGE